jgi:uncharacterized membrane protein YdjX (TVP38/TMEM64 family)
MGAATDCLVILGIVFLCNVVPAFAPPTWSVLVLLRFDTGVPGWTLVALGAVAAASGRFVLALGSRSLRGYFSPERREKLTAARDVLMSGRTRGLAAIGLFAISPLPSAQLFIAAGLIDAPLVRFTLAFFAGRIVSYSFYVAIASAATHSYGTLIRDTLLSPYGVVLQLVMIGFVIAVARIDWIRVAAAVDRWRSRRAS